MKITIKQPLSFSEIGLKDNQEDFLWPLPNAVTVDDRVFLMCDGMGGHDNGELASKTAATALGKYLTSHPSPDGFVTKAMFEQALAYGYDELDKVDNGAVKKMGTTMTCLVLHRGGALVAHIGDSRVYHIRPSLADEHGRSGIIYQSADHSLVNDLLRSGEITEEEAADFPQKNVITRAMQPHLERRYKADILNIDDVQAGDYFFLCCDGVLEQLTNDMLGNILKNKTLDDNAKINAIKKVCDGKTHDNYTCWLIPVLDVQKEETDVAQDDEEQVAVTVEQAPHETPNDAETKVNAETERLARKEAELKAREEALKQREEAARKDAKLKAQQEAMRQREATQKARAMAAAAQKAGGQRQSSGVPPIPPKQIAQQERAEEKKKMVKFALLSFAVFAVIVGAFIFFGSSEEKPKKNTGSEEVSHETDPRDNNNPPRDKSWTDHSSKGSIGGAAQKKESPTDSVTTSKQGGSVQPHSPSSIMQTNNDESKQGSEKTDGKPDKNAPDKHDEKHNAYKPHEDDKPAIGNPEPEAPSDPVKID